MNSFNEAAKRNVLLGLLVAHLIKKYNISVSKERLDAYISQLSSIYENPSDVAKWLEIAVKVERLALGEPTERVAQDHSGHIDTGEDRLVFEDPELERAVLASLARRSGYATPHTDSAAIAAPREP